MSFYFETTKAIQASAVLLRADGRPSMNYMRLLKLLYIAERESLREVGQPIIGGTVLAMRRGPVLQDVLDLIKEVHADAPDWGLYFRKMEYDLALKADPGVAAISPYEVEKLQEVARRYAAMDEWDMVEETQKLPEWRRNDPGASSKLIPTDHILEAVGRTKDAVDILADAQRHAAMSRFLKKQQARKNLMAAGA